MDRVLFAIEDVFTDQLFQTDGRFGFFNFIAGLKNDIGAAWRQLDVFVTNDACSTDGGDTVILQFDLFVDTQMHDRFIITRVQFNAADLADNHTGEFNSRTFLEATDRREAGCYRVGLVCERVNIAHFDSQPGKAEKACQQKYAYDHFNIHFLHL